jgi:hypothetical protein
MTIDLNHFIPRFSANAEAMAALARGVSDAQFRWKPAPDQWSILEVINHLYDEEREDFRTRVRLTLESPQTDWPPINPMGWVTERGYNQRDPEDSLAAFVRERRQSLEWLRALENPNWSSRHTNPRGSMQAGEVLGAWLAHDHLHLRQLNQLHWQSLSRDVAPVSLEYAGGW